MSFVHLSLHTEYSLSNSLVRVKPLMKEVAQQGMPAVAITDESNLFCAIKAYKAAMSNGVKPIIGAQIQLSTSRINNTTLNLICKNLEGYLSLTRLISRGYAEGARDGNDRPLIPVSWLEGQTKGLIALTGGREGEIGRLLCSRRQSEALVAITELRSLFGDDLYIELQRVGHPADDLYVREAVNLAIKTGTAVVATNPVRFIEPESFSSHEVRVAIADGESLQKLRQRETAPATQHQYLKSPEEMIDLFSDIPEAIENTLRIASQCNVELTLGQNYLPRFPVPEGMSEESFLRSEAQAGLERRLKFYFKTEEEIAKHREEYQQRLDFELDTIVGMGFPGYFLIVADFIRWAKKNDIPVGPGRGSGAGSLVAYSLEITDLNPIPYALLFERFLNPERVSMPDFDVDFCMDKRDQVIQYVARTYGQKAVSQIITFGTMAARMVVRDVARALGFSYSFGNNIAKLIPKRPDVTLRDAMAEEPALKALYDHDSEVRSVMDHALSLEGITRQVGKHAGGVLIAPGALTDYTATYNDSEGKHLVSQFDKDDVETAGLVKFDFLGLRNLTIIDHAIKAINMRLKASNKQPIEILDIPLDDKASFDLLQACETTAVFQLESAGMKNLIKRLKPDCFEDIVALVALFRPGPLQSGMVDDFIDRKHGRAEVTYAHPLLKPVLENTYGVIVYQEQVMQIAQVMAGYTLGGADMLRRAMGKKKPEEMAKQRAIFVEGSRKNGIDEDLATSVFDLMEKFAAYGFNKSHSAAYALIAYQTAWLKAHYPADFMAAVLSSDMDNTDKVVRFIHECRSMGIEITPPNANLSAWEFTAHDGKIVYGMGAIKGLGHKAAKEMLHERKIGGNYQNMVDFLYRNTVDKRVAAACINAGMFDYSGLDRGELLEVYPLAHAAGKQLKKQAGQGMLFDMEIPEIPRKNVPLMSETLRLNGERKVLGLHLTGHPFNRYRAMMNNTLTASLADILTNLEDETVEQDKRYSRVTVAGLFADIDIRSNSNGHYATLKLDDGTARIEAAVYTKTYHEYQAFVKEDSLVVVHGDARVNAKTGAVNLVIYSIELLDAYLENLNGKITVDASAEADDSEVINFITQSRKPGDDGPLRVYVRDAFDDVQEVKMPPIRYSGESFQAIKERFGELVTVEFEKGGKAPAKKKVATDLIAKESVQDLEAARQKLREELETHLLKADMAMYKSSEKSAGKSPTP